MKLRESKTNFGLGELFSVHETNVYNIGYMDQVMFMQQDEINLWTDRVSKIFAHNSFVDKFPNTRVVDGTECPVKELYQIVKTGVH